MKHITIRVKPSPHAKMFSPSSADRWLACGASLAKTDAPRSAASIDMLEGTAAHALLDRCLRKNRHPSRYVGNAFIAVEGTKFPVDQAMADAVATMYDWCQPIIAQAVAWGAEVQFTIPQTGDIGTTDFVALVRLQDGRLRLIVADYKHGRGVPVDMASTKQHWLYALGAAAHYGRLYGSIAEYQLATIQPRCPDVEPIQTVIVCAKTMGAFGRTVESRVAAINAGKLREQFQATEKGCQFCPRKGNCKAFAEFATQGAIATFKDFISPKKDAAPCASGEFTPEEFQAVWKRLPILAQFIAAMHPEAMRRCVEEADAHPGLKLVEGRSNRQWKDEDAVARTFAKLKVDLDAYLPRRLVGITEAEKILGAKQSAKVMPKLTSKPRGKPTVADASDPRPSIAPRDAKKIFKDYL